MTKDWHLFPLYTPTLEISLAGNLMTGPRSKSATSPPNNVFSYGKEVGKRRSVSFLSNLFFLSFKVIVWLLSYRFLNLGPGPLSKVSHQQTNQG